MKQLVFWYATVSISLAFGTIIETQVRLLDQSDAFEDTDFCKLLAKRAQQHWESGLFSDCHYDYMQLVREEATELLYTIKVDGDKLTPPHQKGESYDFLMWRVNKLLNGEGRGCGTAVGVGQESDTYDLYLMEKGTPPSMNFLLIAPYSEDFCNQISGKVFGDGQLSVDVCWLIDASDETASGEKLGKYGLSTFDLGTYMEDTLYVDLDLLFLNEMSQGAEHCLFNGYWAPTHKLFPLAVDVLPDEHHIQQEKSCESLMSRSPQHWESGLFVACNFIAPTDQVFSIKLNASNLPEDFPPEQTTDVLSWYANGLINGDASGCHTATWDSFSAVDDEAEKPTENFRLVGPFDEKVCNKIREPSFASQFPDVISCALVEMGTENVGDHYLGTYLVKWNVTMGAQDELQGSDYRRKFLEALNKGKKGCMFNGYWASSEEE